MKVQTSTTEYEFTHGRKPRGYGAWMFKVTGCTPEGYTEVRELSGKGTMAEARRQAVAALKAEADEAGAKLAWVEVAVLP